MLAEGWEMIRAHEAQSQKTLWGHGRPRVIKLLAPLTKKIPMEMDSSPRNLAKSEKWLRHQGLNPASSKLDLNNSALGWQLPMRSLGLPWDRDTSQSRYYSEDSNLYSVFMTSVTTSGASTSRERQTGGTFDSCINCKVVLPKLNDESSTNDQWICLADVQRYMSILESEIDKSLWNGF